MDKQLLKTKFKRIAICVVLSLGIAMSCVTVGSFATTNNVEAMVYSCKRARKNDGTNFTYIEATPKKDAFLFNDQISTYAVTFDNYWHFENRPDIFAFRKWDKSLNSKNNEQVYPLSFDYEYDTYSVPIISIIGNRWEGEFSHLGLELLNDSFDFDLDDKKAIQNSVILSYSLAKKMKDENMLSLVGTNVTSNVMFLNPFYNQARYNNSSSSEVIDEMNIVGIFDESSSEKMGVFIGNDFVFMFGGKEGAYNHCGLKIGCHLSSDDYANHVALSQLLSFENDNSELTFYNCKNNKLNVGELQNNYLKNKSFSKSTMSLLIPAIFAVLLLVLLFFFWWFILRSKENIYLFVSLAMFLFFGVLVCLIEMISIGNMVIVLLNPIGCALYFVCTIILSVLLLKKPSTKYQNDLYSSGTKKKDTLCDRSIPYVGQICSFLSLYVLIFSFFSGIKHFFLSSIIVFLGTSYVMLLSLPKFSLFSKKIKYPILKNIIQNVVPLVFCVMFSTIFVFIMARIIPDFLFNIKFIIFTILGVIMQLIFAKVILVLKQKFIININNEKYSEIDI